MFYKVSLKIRAQSIQIDENMLFTQFSAIHVLQNNFLSSIECQHFFYNTALNCLKIQIDYVTHQLLSPTYLFTFEFLRKCD